MELRASRKKTLFTLVVLLGIPATSFWFLCVPFKTNGSHAPGELIDIGGYKLHIKKSGAGSPSVILEAGLGGFSTIWEPVQAEIATFTHVCSYDRAGMGWSEKSDRPRTALNIVYELYSLLHKANVPPPYILVGHSFGGFLVQWYAATYPDDVYALVLVDALHEMTGESAKSFNRTYYHLLSGAHYSWQWLLHRHENQLTMTLSNTTGIQASYLYSLLKNAIASIPPNLQEPLKSQYLQFSTLTTFLQETEFIAGLSTPLGFTTTKPLIVISRGRAIDQQSDAPALYSYLTAFHENIWDPLQKELATRSTQSKRIVATHSNHNIQWSEPELIVNAVKELVEKYRTQ